MRIYERIKLVIEGEKHTEGTNVVHPRAEGNAVAGQHVRYCRKGYER